MQVNLAVGQIWRMRVGKRRYMVGKITKISERGIALIRLDPETGDEFGKIDELHVMLAAPADLVRQLEWDNFYGMLVPLGTKKKHPANHNV